MLVVFFYLSHLLGPTAEQLGGLTLPGNAQMLNIAQVQKWGKLERTASFAVSTDQRKVYTYTS